ncbi:MAG TPA: TonB-dependent receptor, partial [Acidobacteriota bacterium]|nr:TonB-dependent receptor [Acidobacteriota bacterium]
MLSSSQKCAISVSLVLFMSLAAVSVFAQGTTGTIAGVIKDETGDAMPGVLVSVVGEKGIKSVTTDADGKFSVSGLAPGVYDIKAELSGYVTIGQSDVKVDAGATADVPLVMKPGSLQELMVVTASKVETPLINAPATMSVVSSATIESSPAQNYGDLLRSVPGLNVIQLSARDINMTSRQATSTLAETQLALLDGRSIYQDFFGFVLWDFLPVNFNEVKQIEVIRGPASAVWGANAMTGVVNIITKSPREMVGTSLTFTGSFFDRTATGTDLGGNTVNGPDLGNGGAFGGNITHAGIINDTWSYKLSGGYFDSDPYARPVGLIPKSTVPNTNIETGGVPYSAASYTNSGTSQPKFDIRFDQELGRDSKLIYAGGFAGSSGIIQTGIGPFDIQKGTDNFYGKVNYSNGNFKLNFFTNIIDGDAINLLTAGADGKPIDFIFKTQTYDVEVGHSVTVHGNNTISFGGNFRRNNFDLSIAPLGDNRNEAGGYVQDEIFTDKFRFVLGARVDKFSVIDHAVFSPRLTFMYKPAPEHSFRASFNRAFRSPSLIN